MPKSSDHRDEGAREIIIPIRPFRVEDYIEQLKAERAWESAYHHEGGREVEIFLQIPTLQDYIENVTAGYALKFFYYHRTEHSLMVAHSIHNAIQNHLDAAHFFTFAMDRRTRQVGNETPLEYFMRHAVAAKLDFHGMIFKHSSVSAVPKALLFEAAERENLEAFKTLIRYGLGMSVCMGPKQLPWEERFDLHKKFVEKLFTLMVQKSGVFDTSTLEILKECYLIFTESVPFPYVVIQLKLRGPIATMSEFYMKHFPNMASIPHGPRSLQHLARCSIRESLYRSWNLPKGIWKLNFPKRLKRYLNLHTDLSPVRRIKLMCFGNMNGFVSRSK